MKKITVLCIAILSISSCKQQVEQNPNTTPNTDFTALVEAYYQEGLQLNPINATVAGDYRYNDTFPNVLSKAHKAKTKAYYTTYKAKLADFPDASLTETQQMSKAILAWECDIHLEELAFNADLTPIDQMWSINLFMGQLASGAGAQPFATVEDYQKWTKRVDGYLQWMASAEANMRQGMQKGYVLPKALIVKVLPQLQALTVKDVDEHLFYQPIHKLPAHFSEEDKASITAGYTRMIQEKIIPAYQKLHAFMSDTYLKAGRATSGIQGQPDGDAYYAHQIKKYTTTDLTADEIHELGLSEVARIRAEMEAIKKEVGFTGDLKAFFDHVRTDKNLMPYTQPQQVIDHFNAIHERMKPQLQNLFDKTPKTPFEVRRTEAFREKSASAEYNAGSLDGTRAGIFYVPIPDVTSYNLYSDESLFLHEAIPGHHYQIALTQESQVLPQFRKTLWYSGYGEGWALYSESLGEELGLYTDPYQRFGKLGAEMHRAIRLVVDTGLHAKEWTREQAIAYSLANEAESEAGITAEIERYMANPGQALSYKIGSLTIRKLRDQAEATLGDAFDIREFHNQVLETGCVPLALLEYKIEAWIEANN